MIIKGYRITVGTEHYEFGFGEAKVIDIFANRTWLGVMLVEDIVGYNTYDFKNKIKYMINNAEQY